MNEIYEDGTWKIVKRDGVNVILNGNGEEVDRVLIFDEAITLLKQYKASVK